MLRKTVVIVTLVCLSALVGLAGDKSGKSNAAEHAAKLQAELHLTAEQTAAVEKVFAEFIPKLEAVRAHMQAGREGMKAQHSSTEAHAEAAGAKQAEMEAVHAEMKAQTEERRTQMRQILNDEQYQRFLEMEAAHTEKMGGGGHGGAQDGGHTGSHGEKQGGHSN